MSTENIYYVYLHRRKDNNEVFYIGKGKYNRASSIQGRNINWMKIFTRYGVCIEYYQTDLSEKDAFDLEFKLIAEYSAKGVHLTNIYGNLIKESPTNNDKIYSFTNVETGKIFVGTLEELKLEFKLSPKVNILVNSPIKSRAVESYILTDNITYYAETKCDLLEKPKKSSKEKPLPENVQKGIFTLYSSNGSKTQKPSMKAKIGNVTIVLVKDCHGRPWHYARNNPQSREAQEVKKQLFEQGFTMADYLEILS